MAFMGIHPGIYNVLSCKGFINATTAGGMSLGNAGALDLGNPCSMGKLGAVILFFVIALINKWGGEELDIPFNFWISLGFGLVGYVIAITFTGSMKFAFFIGLLASLAGGYGAPYFLGEGSSEGS